MAISSIDVMQTEQIEDLQDDVKELRDKLNLLVSDITDVDGVAGSNGVVATRDGLTVKLNQAITDASDLDSVINAGYSVASGGGSSPIGILKRMDELFAALSHHENTHTPYSYAGSSLNANNGPYEETHPPPVYVVETKSMITLKTTPEKRAKKLARKIQGQITAEDRVNTNK